MGFVHHNPGLKAAQHKPGPAPLNCTVNHWLLDALGSPGQDHYTSPAFILFKGCLFFTCVLPPCTSQSNNAPVHFGLWSEEMRDCCWYQGFILFSLFFVWLVFVLFLFVFHVIPFSDNLLKLVIQKAWNMSHLRAEHTGKQPRMSTELLCLWFSQYSTFYIFSVMGQHLLHWHFVFFLFRLEQTGQIWDIWLGNGVHTEKWEVEIINDTWWVVCLFSHSNMLNYCVY